MRREERVTVQGPVKEQQPDGMSHRGFAGGELWPSLFGAVETRRGRPQPHRCSPHIQPVAQGANLK